MWIVGHVSDYESSSEDKSRSHTKSIERFFVE